MELFEKLGLAQLCVMREDGPVVRPVHPIVHGGGVYLHGRRGHADWAGRPAVLVAQEVLAEVPSWMRHPERACPATTWFRSTEVRGTLVEVVDPAEKAAVLQSMMERWQPEGGYRPLSAGDPMYTGPLQGVLVLRLDGEATTRVKVGANLAAPDWDRVTQGLWERGGTGVDGRLQLAIDLAGRTPGWLTFPGGRALLRVPDARVGEAVALVRDRYWNTMWSDATVAAAHLGSTAWVGLERDGELVATARAVADGGKLAYVMDVAVRDDLHGEGLGRRLLRLLESHPTVRGCAWISLHTRGAEGFYRRLGYADATPPADRIELRRYRTLAGPGTPG